MHEIDNWFNVNKSKFNTGGVQLRDVTKELGQKRQREMCI